MEIFVRISDFTIGGPGFSNLSGGSNSLSSGKITCLSEIIPLAIVHCANPRFQINFSILYNTNWIFDTNKFDKVKNNYTGKYREICKQLVLEGDSDQRCHNVLPHG